MYVIQNFLMKSQKLFSSEFISCQKNSENLALNYVATLFTMDEFYIRFPNLF